MKENKVDDFSKEVGKNLKTYIENYRKKYHCTQDRVARDILFIEPTLLSKKLNGKAIMTLENILDFSRALGVSRYELIGSEEAPDANVTLISDKIADLSPEQRANALQILDLFCESVKQGS